MISHALLTFYRSLSRHRLYAALNVLGLAAGVAVFLVLTMVVRYESNYDRWLPHADEVYRMDQTWFAAGRAPLEDSTATFVAYDLLRADFPRIAAATRRMVRDEPVSAGPVIDSEQVAYVDPSFFDVLEYPLAAGDRATALSAPSSVAVTESIARKYFGAAQATGRTLLISHDGVKRSFKVTAVMRDMPKDTTVAVGVVAPLTPAVEEGVSAFRSWGSSSGETFLRFRTRADAQGVAAGLRDFVNRRAAGDSDDQEGPHPDEHLKLSLVRLTDAHLHDADIPATPPGVDRRVVLSLGAIGVLALITAAINYVNLATARAGLRAREVALRKVMGATRRMLLLQFLAEAVAFVASAALIGLAMTELAVPVVNALGGWAMRIDYAQAVPLLVGLTLVVGVGAGLYPALLLSGHQPAAVLAAVRTPAGGRLGTRLRSLLVLVQFTGAIAFAISTLVIDAQATFLREAARGFDREGLIIVESMSASELMPRQSSILAALREVGGVASATVSDREPNSHATRNSRVARAGLVGEPPVLIQETVGRDYFKTYGVRLVAGRLFDDAHPSDDAAGDPAGGRQTAVVLNVRAVAALGFADPHAALGQTISILRRGAEAGSDAADGRRRTVVGVVQDVRYTSSRDAVAPQVYTYDTHGIVYGEAAIRVRGASDAEMMHRLRAAWNAAAPDNPFVAKTADERLADFYEPDQNRARLFSAGSVLAVGIACLGLYGLASFSTARRVKEIGIRKTLGASTREMLTLLVFQFIRPVLLANVLAWPVAWAAMRAWLSGFDQRIALSPAYFAAVGGASIAISVLTVLGQAWFVARAEPARALRYE